MSCWLWLPLLKSFNSSSSLSPKLRYEPLYCCYGYSCWSLWTHPSSWAWCVIDWRRWVTTRASWSFVCPKPGSATPMTLPTISIHKGNSQRTHRACRPTSPGSVSSLVCVWWPAPPFLLAVRTFDMQATITRKSFFSVLCLLINVCRLSSSVPHKRTCLLKKCFVQNDQPFSIR